MKDKFAIDCYMYCRNIEDKLCLHQFIKQSSKASMLYCLNVYDNPNIRQSITEKDVRTYCKNIKSRPWIHQFAHWTGEELIEMSTIINGSAEEDKIEQYQFENMFNFDEGESG